MTRNDDDLFITALHELHNEAPIELLNSLRNQLDQISRTNPNSAQTAHACLRGLSSDSSTLLHVLTAAYLINGGVMIKQHKQCDDTGIGEEFTDFEEELKALSLTMHDEHSSDNTHTKAKSFEERKHEYDVLDEHSLKKLI